MLRAASALRVVSRASSMARPTLARFASRYHANVSLLKVVIIVYQGLYISHCGLQCVIAQCTERKRESEAKRERERKCKRQQTFVRFLKILPILSSLSLFTLSLSPLSLRLLSTADVFLVVEPHTCLMISSVLSLKSKRVCGCCWGPFCLAHVRLLFDCGVRRD